VQLRRNLRAWRWDQWDQCTVRIEQHGHRAPRSCCHKAPRSCCHKAPRSRSYEKGWALTEYAREGGEKNNLGQMLWTEALATASMAVQEFEVHRPDSAMLSALSVMAVNAMPRLPGKLLRAGLCEGGFDSEPSDLAAGSEGWYFPTCDD